MANPPKKFKDPRLTAFAGAMHDTWKPVPSWHLMWLEAGMAGDHQEAGECGYRSLHVGLHLAGLLEHHPELREFDQAAWSHLRRMEYANMDAMERMTVLMHETDILQESLQDLRRKQQRPANPAARTTRRRRRRGRSATPEPPEEPEEPEEGYESPELGGTTDSDAEHEEMTPRQQLHHDIFRTEFDLERMASLQEAPEEQDPQARADNFMNVDALRDRWMDEVDIQVLARLLNIIIVVFLRDQRAPSYVRCYNSHTNPAPVPDPHSGYFHQQPSRYNEGTRGMLFLQRQGMHYRLVGLWPDNGSEPLAFTRDPRQMRALVRMCDGGLFPPHEAGTGIDQFLHKHAKQIHFKEHGDEGRSKRLMRGGETQKQAARRAEAESKRRKEEQAARGKGKQAARGKGKQAARGGSAMAPISVDTDTDTDTDSDTEGGAAAAVASALDRPPGAEGDWQPGDMYL